jgi:hypothetical protein
MLLIFFISYSLSKKFFSVIKKDFGLSNFAKTRTKIFTDFKTSVEYYLTNKYYDVTDSRFGKNSDIRFEDDDVYDTTYLVSCKMQLSSSHNLSAV